MNAERVLVTGGAGYIGSHVCKALAGAGFTPVTYDNLSRGHEWAVRWGPFEAGELSDRARLDEVVKNHRPVAAMHFAALTYVEESVAEPAVYYRNNVAGTLTLLEALRDSGVLAMVFSSSAAIYGVPETSPIPESHPWNPVNPYGASKLMIERMLRDFAGAYGLRSASLRYFNAAGAGAEAEIGEDHDPETHLIPLVLEAAMGLRPHIEIFGDDYDTPDGTCVRDYIHVSDLAEAHLLALKRLLDGGETLFLNLGIGDGYSVREVIEAAREVTGKEIPARTGARRPGDPPVLVADAARAKKTLGWAPQRPALETQIEDAWRWHLKHR